jgi:hypothetical protein
MWRLLCLSSTSLLCVAGCSDDTCGPGSAAADGLTVTGAGVALTYGAMGAGLNNDCPDLISPPPVPTSVTVHGLQTGAADQRRFTLCIPRPDTLTKQTMPLVHDTNTGIDVRLVDLQGMDASCTYTLGNTVTGTVKTSGLCGNGADNAGFALTIDATVQLNRECMSDTIDVQLSGTVAVAADQ